MASPVEQFVLTYTPEAARAYLAGREEAKIYSVDPALAEVPAEHRSEAQAYRDGLRDEQTNAKIPDRLYEALGQKPPTPKPSAPTATNPEARKPVPPPSPAPAPKAAAPTTRLQRYRLFYQGLAKQPVNVLQEVARRQVEQIDAAYAAAPRVKKVEWLRPDYANVRSDLDGARERLKEADGLAGKTDPASVSTRRTSYLRAYNSAFTAGESLASILGDESFLVLAISEVVVPAIEATAEAGKKVLNAAENLAADTANTLKYVAYGVAGLAGVALIAFANQRGKRR